MTKDEVLAVLKKVRYRDWKFSLIEEGELLFLQIRFVLPCACRGTEELFEHRCRKWRISPRSTSSELVQLAFQAVITAEEHEARENFKYKDRAIFGPHFDVDKLVELYDAKAWDMRINSFSTHEASISDNQDV